MTLMHGLDTFKRLGRLLGEPLGHAAAAAAPAEQAAAGGSDDPLSSAFSAGKVEARPPNFSAAVKSKLGEVCMISGEIVLLAWHRYGNHCHLVP